MHSWLTGTGPGLGIVAAKAALMYLVAVLGLRAAQRRTLAQWTAVDFAAAVAVGAIIGRTALAPDQSFLVGATALLTILAAHSLAQLRQQGVQNIDELRYVLYETKGNLTIVEEASAADHPHLIEEGLRSAAGFREQT